VLLPDHLRINVYTITTTRNRWTGKTTTKKEPSRGERMYRHAAKGLCVVFVVAHVALLGASLDVPSDGRGILAPALEQQR
jgi:hypothetical protein